MPTFDTPEPISVTVELSVGNLRVAASDRADTVVDVHPSDADDESDVEAAQQVTVDHTGGKLRVIGPKRLFDFSKKTRSVEVSIELPSGSALAAHLAMGDVRCGGRLGECRVKTTGHVEVEQSGPLRQHTGFGRVTVGRVTGDAEIHTGGGKIQVGEVHGSAQVKNSSGDTMIGTVAGDVRVRNASGTIDVERAGAGVDVKTSSGSIRLGEVARGSVVLESGAGDLSVGIAEGTAAWLDLNTGFGHVRNQLENAVRPETADETVEVRGRTGYGDITVHRS